MQSQFSAQSQGTWPRVEFISATGGTITTSGDYKIHTFTASGPFNATAAIGKPVADSSVDYMVVAGGGGSGNTYGGGAGAGGFRESPGTSTGSYSVSPIAGGSAIALTTQDYPIVVGGGGAGPGTSPGNNKIQISIIDNRIKILYKVFHKDIYEFNKLLLVF
jgi:hypothetical protein